MRRPISESGRGVRDYSGAPLVRTGAAPSTEGWRPRPDPPRSRRAASGRVAGPRNERGGSLSRSAPASERIDGINGIVVDRRSVMRSWCCPARVVLPLARLAVDRRFGLDVAGFHHQHVAFPAAHRVAHPGPDRCVLAAIGRDDARLADRAARTGFGDQEGARRVVVGPLGVRPETGLAPSGMVTTSGIRTSWRQAMDGTRTSSRQPSGCCGLCYRPDTPTDKRAKRGIGEPRRDSIILATAEGWRGLT